MTVRSDFYVYMLLRPDVWLPFYVGKGSGRRIQSHMHTDRCNSHKARIIRKLQASGQKPIGVKICENLTEQQAFNLEMRWIACWGRFPDGPLVNKTPGGEGVSGKRSPAEIARLVALHTGRKRTDATRAAIGAAQRGRTHSTEHIEAHAASLRGRHLSSEHRAKISAALKGRRCPDGTRKALIESNRARTGYKWSPVMRAKISAIWDTKRAAL